MKRILFLKHLAQTSTRVNIITGYNDSQILEALLFWLICFPKPPLCLSLHNPSLLGQGAGCPFLSVQLGNANAIVAEPRQRKQTITNRPETQIVPVSNRRQRGNRQIFNEVNVHVSDSLLCCSQLL